MPNKKAIEDCESLDWYHDAIAFITFDIINSEKGSMVSKHLNYNLFLLHGVNYIKFISIYYVVEIVLQFGRIPKTGRDPGYAEKIKL